MKRLLFITLVFLCCDHALNAQTVLAKADKPQSFKGLMRETSPTFFQSKDEKLSILALFLQPFSDLFTKYSNIKNLSL